MLSNLGPRRIRFSAALCAALSICILYFGGLAQTTVPTAKKDSLPRVGLIKDYSATGLTTGCGNLYFYRAAQARPAKADAYVFLARGDGSYAWMNLNGRDVRLKQIKSLTRQDRKLQRYYYRLGQLRISVVIETPGSEDVSANEGEPMFQMKITMRQGRLVRTVRAVGDTDC